jgi:hypothetical protein
MSFIESFRKDLACIRDSAKAGFRDTPEWCSDARLENKLRVRFQARAEGLRDPAYRRGALYLPFNFDQWVLSLGFEEARKIFIHILGIYQPDVDICIDHVKYTDYFRDLLIIFEREGYDVCESLVKRLDSQRPTHQRPGGEHNALIVWDSWVSCLKDGDVIKKGWRNMTEEERQRTGPERARRLGARQSPAAIVSTLESPTFMRLEPCDVMQEETVLDKHFTALDYMFLGASSEMLQ